MTQDCQSSLASDEKNGKRRALGICYMSCLKDVNKCTAVDCSVQHINIAKNSKAIK